MKKVNPFFIVIGLFLLLISSGVSASGDTPAILASLDKANISQLEDTTLAEIRGQVDPLYVLVKLTGYNDFDWGPKVQWTLNPYLYRYGYYGGPGWSNLGYAPVDAMDALFMAHDLAYGTNPAADALLLYGLNALPNKSSYWGPIYDSSPDGAPNIVLVASASFIGGRIYNGWRPMAYSEYSRRQAFAAISYLQLPALP